MSVGNPVIHTRISHELLRRMEEQICSLKLFRDKRAYLLWDKAAFVRAAIKEKLDKMARSRRPRPRARKLVHAGQGDPPAPRTRAPLEQVAPPLTSPYGQNVVALELFPEDNHDEHTDS